MMMKTEEVLQEEVLQPAPLSFGEIEERAEQVAEEEEFNRETMTIRDWTKALGGSIEVLEHPDYKQLQSGSLEVFGHRDFVIHLSPITGILRDNFTIAHELGHLFLHTGDPWGSRHIRIGRYYGKTAEAVRLEQQANRFAAALLMPRDEFVQIAQRTDQDLQILAGRFGVSVPAAQARLYSLRSSLE